MPADRVEITKDGSIVGDIFALESASKTALTLRAASRSIREIQSRDHLARLGRDSRRL